MTFILTKISNMKKIICIFVYIYVVITFYWYKQKLVWSRRYTMQQLTGHENYKYILFWTRSYMKPFKDMGEGQQIFIERGCVIKNCYVTNKKRLIGDVAHFHAILFHGPELELYRFPKKRSPHQKYIFVSTESSNNYPLTNKRYDGLFNWTWTYKLNSDMNYGYIIITNKLGEIVGPKAVMHWLKPSEMKPISHTIKERLRKKNKAAAWFVSNCQPPSKRNLLGIELQKGLAKYNLTLDIYGKCGTKQCPKENMTDCLQMLETYYYFYLAFENSFSEDYVTEKVLHALQHFTVPIVYGAANYTRFLPDGSYLNARSYNINRLVQLMVYIIKNKEIYYDFFRWNNHYSFFEGNVDKSPMTMTPDTDAFCKLCSKINDANSVNQTSIYELFTEWWNK